MKNNKQLSPVPTKGVVEQTVTWLRQRIAAGEYALGQRLPSVRALAGLRGISASSAAAVYSRLCTLGLVQAKAGSGFYVCAAPAAAHATAMMPSTVQEAFSPHAPLDTISLLRNMMREMPQAAMPGSGNVPPDSSKTHSPYTELMRSSLRSVARPGADWGAQYSDPMGYQPLRHALAAKLQQQHGISASAGQILLTSGVTQGLDLVARYLLRPGDTVLVEAPSWFVVFGVFAALGVKVLGVPRLHDGPDFATMQALAQEHKPKLFISNSILHNPTGTSTSAQRAHQVLQLAEAHGFYIVEDDIFGDLALHAGVVQSTGLRMATLDQLNRVIYLGGFSKVLAADLRVGYIACHADLASELMNLKMLTMLATPSVPERMVCQLLESGQYQKYAKTQALRLQRAHEKSARALQALGIYFFALPQQGIFLWGDVGRDASALAAKAAKKGWMLAPGALFMPQTQGENAPNPAQNWMRFNVLNSSRSDFLSWIAAELDS